MGKQRRKKGNYAERKNKDGSVSRFSIPTIRGKPKWVKIPNLAKYDGKRGARRHLEWCRDEYGGDWATETFAQSAAAHLRFIKGGTYGTYRVREQAIRLHLDPHFGRKRIAEIKRADVQDFIRIKTTSLSSGYVRLNLVATLRAILQPYVADDRLPRNAASGSPAFQFPPSSKAPKKLNGSITTKQSADGRTLVDGGRALTRDEVALLLTHSSPQHWTLFLTMVYTGMRLGEALAMQWKHFTEGDDGVGLYAVESNVDKRNQLSEVKTRSSRAEIALSAVVVQALSEQRAIVAAAKLRAGKEWTDHDLIFPRHGRCLHWGLPQSQGPPRKALGRAARRAGIGHIRPHDLRHTCASLLIAEGLNIKQVSSHLRHSSVGVTLDTYGHLYPGDRNEVAHAMDRVLGIAKNG
jgi:integrase